MSVALTMAALSFGSSLLGSSDDGQWKVSAHKAGANTAAIDAAKTRALALIPGKERENAEAILVARINADAEEAASVAEATVQAAAAGVSGASVDQTIQQHQSSADDVRASIEKQRQAKALQIRQDKEDIFWEGENQKFSTKVNNQSAGSRILSAGLGAAGAFISNR